MQFFQQWGGQTALNLAMEAEKKEITKKIQN